jgi:DNA-binding NarL/FixJ family response regulator
VIRVVVADDQTLVRGSFRVLIETAEDLMVVGEAGDGRAAIAVTAREKPDVVLMDVRMPELDGIAATREITAHGPAKVLILTTFDLDEYVYAALRAGASGFLLKDAPPGDLLAAIRVTAAGDGLLAPSVTRRLIAEFASRPVPDRPPRRTLDGVTDREREERLQLSVATAKTHVSRLLTKLAARDRAQLVIVAYESGLIRPA